MTILNNAMYIYIFLLFSDDDFDMSRYSSSGYSSAEVRCLRDQVPINTL